MDWLDLLVVQETLKTLLQNHSSKASVLRHSAFFIAQLSHPYMTTWKPIALTRQTFVGKVMSLLFNVLSRLIITFLPRSKHLLISWLQSPSAVILKPPKINSVTVSTICHEVMGPDVMCPMKAQKGDGRGYAHLGPNCHTLDVSYSIFFIRQRRKLRLGKMSVSPKTAQGGKAEAGIEPTCEPFKG